MARPQVRSYRNIPVLTGGRRVDKVSQVDRIILQHDLGDFSRSAILVDELMMDDRIMGLTRQRVAALQSAPIKFVRTGETPAHTEAAELLGDKDGQPGLWREMIAPDAQASLMKWGWFLGIGLAQICWRTEEDAWTPWLRVWHPQFIRWDMTRRRFLVQTLDGEVVLPRPDEQPEGDGEWFLFCPYGVEDGWKDGLVRAIARKYVSRSWAERDWDRHGEKLGLGILKAKTPPNAKDPDVKKFFRSLQNLHSETVVELPQGGVDANGKQQPGYDVELEEATALTWQSFDKRKGGIDVDLAVLLTGQNLMAQVDGGSLAAAGMHGLVRQDIAVSDAEIGPKLGKAVVSHWALHKYGDRKVAPIPTYEVLPQSDEKAEAETLKTLAEGVEILKRAEPTVDIVAILKSKEVPMLEGADAEKAIQEKADRDAAAAAKFQRGPGGAGNDNGGGAGGGDQPAEPNAPAPDDAGPSDDATPTDEKAALTALSALTQAKGGALEDAQLRMLESVFGKDMLRRVVERHQAMEAAAAAEKQRALKNLPSGVVSRRAFAGLPIAIENPVGSLRLWTDADGKQGSTRMKHDYGFIEGHLSGDGEELDCYLGPNEQAANVYVVHQLLAPAFKKHDEDKCLIGFDSEADARAAYAAHRSDGERAIGSISVLPVSRFLAKLRRRSPESTSKIRASQDLDVLHQALVALDQNVAGRGKPTRYQEELLARASKLGVSAMAPVVAALKREIAACTSPEDLQKRILRLARGLDQPAELQDVIYRMSLMSNLHGRDAVMQRK